MAAPPTALKSTSATLNVRGSPTTYVNVPLSSVNPDCVPERKCTPLMAPGYGPVPPMSCPLAIEPGAGVLVSVGVGVPVSVVVLVTVAVGVLVSVGAGVSVAAVVGVGVGVEGVVTVSV